MLTREDIIDVSVRMGCNRDLKRKGMATTPLGNVFCVATLSGDYPDQIYYERNQFSPTEVYYCGVYSINAAHPFDMNNHESWKNITVTKTNGNDRFVYFFEKTQSYSNEYFFHGRYKYASHEVVHYKNSEHKFDVIFKLLFVDRPNLK